MLIIQTDGAYEQKSKKAAISYRIKDFSGKNLLVETALQIKANDNHEAEFLALTQALQSLINDNQTSEIIQIQSDSKGLLDAINKNYSKHYADRLAEIMTKLNQFSMYYTKLLSDKENKAAHSLAIKALHQN